MDIQKAREIIMTDKEMKDQGLHEGHDHDCECGDDCDCGSNTILLDMEDGTQKEFTILDMVEVDGKKYIALSEVGSMEYDILEMTEDGDSVELNYIEDDKIYEDIAAEFEKLFAGAFEDEEETED